MKVKKAIIPAAGFGTRFLPITKAIPKVMLPIVDKPAIHYLVKEAIASGIEEILIITGPKKNMIKQYFSKSTELEDHLAKTGNQELLDLVSNLQGTADIFYSVQKDPLGLGHAIYGARNFVGDHEWFAVLLGDDIVQAEIPCLSQLLDIFEQYPANLIGAKYVLDKDVNHYGIVSGTNITDRLISVKDLVEKPNKEHAPSNLAIMGRYVIHSDIFKILRATKPGKGGEIQLTDALREIAKIREIYAYVFEGKRYDLGDKLGYLQANIDYALQHDELSKELRSYLTNLHLLN